MPFSRAIDGYRDGDVPPGAANGIMLKFSDYAVAKADQMETEESELDPRRRRTHRPSTHRPIAVAPTSVEEVVQAAVPTSEGEEVVQAAVDAEFETFHKKAIDADQQQRHNAKSADDKLRHMAATGLVMTVLLAMLVSLYDVEPILAVFFGHGLIMLAMYFAWNDKC
jgi:hypothetical protein